MTNVHGDGIAYAACCLVRLTGCGPFISRSSSAPIRGYFTTDGVICRQRLPSLGHTFLYGESTWLFLGTRFSSPSCQSTIQDCTQDILWHHRCRRCGKRSTNGATLVSIAAPKCLLILLVDTALPSIVCANHTNSLTDALYGPF